MHSLCHTNIKSLNEYFDLKPSRVYVCDLNHNAPKLINEAKAQGIPVYGSSGRKPVAGRWIAVCASGLNQPTTYWVKLSTGTVLLNYSNFDTKKDKVPADEMKRVVTQIEEFEPSLEWSTSNRLIEKKIPLFLERQCILSDKELKYYDYLDVALRGGANHVMMPQQNIQLETHIDFHQIYAYVMSKEEFPCGKPVEVDGYYEHPFAIYTIEPGTIARVKKDGYPLIPLGQDYTGMAGADGEWFDAGEVIQFISDVDLNTMIRNYEFKNNYIGICSTLYYPESFKGSEWFKPIVDEIYTKRKKYKGQPEERFFKILNEVLPGHFERRSYYGGFWVKNFQPNKDSKTAKRYNPKIGIFITAYARRELDKLIHLFPHNKVIGFDTDCVFFAGSKNALPYPVLELFGDNPGQVHEDGYYRDVYHKASKSYYGFDAVTGESFTKIAGLSRSGKAWAWNSEIREYELKEVQKDEARQTFTL